jgi:hypothetical protein
LWLFFANGKNYLVWEFVEADNFAIRHEPLISRFYRRKKVNSGTTPYNCLTLALP